MLLAFPVRTGTIEATVRDTAGAPVGGAVVAACDEALRRGDHAARHDGDAGRIALRGTVVDPSAKP